jgi:hypothetical protein
MKTPCPNCGAELDWWKIILKTTRDIFPFFIFGSIGAQSTVFKIKLVPDQSITLKFVDHGIPPDARILYINYTPQGPSLFPVEMHGNTPQRHIIPRVVTLYPVPSGSGLQKETQISVLVIWVSNTLDNESWQNMVDAFHAYSIDSYQSMVIPANVAVESTLKRLLMSFLDKTDISTKRVEGFLDDGATYSHQLNVLLPALLSFTDAPLLPDHIRGLLNQLRKLRNKMAHSGGLGEPIGKDDAAEYICAALFGFRYFNLIEPALLGE